jgi:glycosyltransferase involved in cell wall biosynthesis
MKPRVLMLVINPMTADARVHKEARSLAAAGYDVDVVATAAPGLPTEEFADGYRIVRIPYRRVVREAIVDRYQRTNGQLREERVLLTAALTRGAPPPAEALVLRLRILVNQLRRAAERIRWLLGGLFLKTVRSRLLSEEYRRSIGAEILRRWQPVDAIHAHDLGPLATALWLADRWTTPTSRPRVIYDSHELYVEQAASWTPRERWAWRCHERRTIRRADAVITVSPGIASELQRRYRLDVEPTVILNTPAGAQRPFERSLRSEVSGLDGAPLVVYVGAVKPGRGVERLLPALLTKPEWHLALVGPGENAHVSALMEEAVRSGVGGRLHLVAAVPSDDLPAYIASADVGIHPMEPSCLNHDLALPNKLFDYVLAGLPVAVSDLTEMRRFVRTHGIGVVFDPHDEASISRALGSLLDDPSRSRPNGEVIEQLKNQYAWPAQARLLVSVYRSLLGDRSP